MNSAVDAIDAMVAEALARLAVLRELRGRLAPAEPELKAPPAPAKAAKPAAPKKKSGRGGPGRKPWGQYEVNGQDIPVSERQHAAMELLAAAPEGVYVAAADLLPIFDNKKGSFTGQMAKLNVSLAVAGARAANVRGKGYRLETLGAGEEE